MSTLRYAVIGTGGIANLHLEQISKEPGIEVVGLADSHLAQAEKAALRYPSALAFTDPGKMLRESQPDLVSICTPNRFHCDLTLLVLKHGAHVVCEKPMAMTVAEARRMEAARQKAGKLGGIQFSYRNNSAFRFARHLIAQGELGPLTRVNTVYLQSWLGAEANPYSWRNDRSVAGFGALGDLGVHMIDAVRFITGLNYRRVVGTAQILVQKKRDHEGKLQNITTDTNSSFLAELDGDVIASFETSQVVPGYGNYFRLEVSGHQGTLVVNSEHSDSLEIFAGPSLTHFGTWKSGLARVIVPTDFNRFQAPAMPAAMIHAIRGEKVDMPTFADGLAAQEVLEAIGTSMKTSKWITLHKR